MAVDNTGWSEGQKWLAGIAASIIVAVAVFLLTQEGGPFNPPETTTTTTTTSVVPARPVVAISEFDLPFIMSSAENEVVNFTISNEGDAVARGCALGGDVSPIGDEFSVEPHSSTTISWGVRSYGLQGSVTFSAYVTCENAESAPVARETFVG